ncbi:hypothetical protein NBE98_20325 [Clostridium swellfunianum]|uniref:hypothetical protein n=1 Tax=Clostridium swellfunianum TaxID=1367462 RepID=UPI0020306A1E|nr:hypothetical protein [Clostridium swellfunianum]MCM0650713.1 hypothetical protein [Clostridium swellfunianum]
MKNLNKYYIKQKENEFSKLEEKKLKLSREIEQEKEIFKTNEEKLGKLEIQNLQLRDQYNSLKKIIINRGIVLDIENNRYDIKEWDNLYLEKKGNKYVVVLKGGIVIYNFESYVYEILKDLFEEQLTSSLVVIRITPRLIKVQLRFREKEQ